MEPLDEKELSHLLRQWEAPPAPASLTRGVLPQRGRWWRWLFTGTIRIPVPVGVAAVVLIGLWIHYSKVPAGVPVAQPAPTVSLADFQPVKQLEPHLMGAPK
jgi:hypothetical protein